MRRSEWIAVLAFLFSLALFAVLVFWPQATPLRPQKTAPISMSFKTASTQQGGGRFCSMHQGQGWWIWFVEDGTIDPCQTLQRQYCTTIDCVVVNSGRFSLYDINEVRVQCNGFKTEVIGEGSAPLDQAYEQAARSQASSCTFYVTTRQSEVGSPTVTEIPLFQKPFSGNFRTTNYFDHDMPRQFKDNNGYLVTFQGEQRRIRSRGANIDGHEGYDWLLPEGTPLLAVADGTVTFAGEGQPFICPILDNQTVTGMYVTLLHKAPNGERLVSLYSHLSRVDVQKGQAVRAGDVIGLSGNTGCSTGPHLHFGVYRLTHTNGGNRALIDPYGWGGTTPDPWSNDQEGAMSIRLWKPGHAPDLEAS